MDLLSLVGRLVMDKTEYDKGLDDAGKEAESFGAKLKSGLANAAKMGAAAFTAVTAAAGAMTAAITSAAGETAAYGDNIDKASQKLGISAEAYQEWEAVLQHSGTSMDAMGMGMKTLAGAAADGSEAFEMLGISQQKAAGMSKEELFETTITALQNVRDENQRAQLAQELFGRSAMELGPLLNTSAADTQAMRDRVHELGGVMSNEAVKAAAAYQDSLQDMQTAMDGAKRGLIAEFLPALTTVMDGITALFTGGEGVEKISEGLSMFVGKISEMAPKVIDTGSRIVLALGEAIVENLPALLSAATQAVVTLTKGIIQQLPMIVNSGFQALLAFAQSIAEALPELIPVAVEAIAQIVEALTDPGNLNALIDAAVAIIGGLLEGLIRAVPKLLEAAPRIVANLAVALISAAPKLLEAGVKLIGALGEGIVDSAGDAVEAVLSVFGIITTAIGDIIRGAFNWGQDLIDNFIGGIRSMWERARGAISSFAGMIKSFLGFSEPEEGPLSNFHTYAPDMMALFAKGIEDNQRLVANAIDDAFSFGERAAQPAGGEVVEVPRSGGGERPINVIFEFDGVQRWVYRLNKAEEQRVGVKLGAEAT